ncbi:hypothetical protein F5148DRAFT_124896 [Russula earlei]|uniref:Uncharacterized protein n=1 Tax=Russula earlei TaxID=71964 RepID=A0ACC0UKH4_9AGAM|nr:hypothetical protein F5148DRAFT_124896 [Russula earlei]
MLIALASAALLSILHSPAVRAGFSVQSPVFTQCATVHFSWDDTMGPYDVLIANQSDPCGYAVGDLGQLTNNSVSWNVSIPAGWIVLISVEDGFTDEAWSEPIQVQPSNDVSCLSPELAALAAINDAEFSDGVLTATATQSLASTSSGVAKAGASPTGSLGNAASSARQAPSLAALLGAISVVASAFFAMC